MSSVEDAIGPTPIVVEHLIAQLVCAVLQRKLGAPSWWQHRRIVFTFEGGLA